MQPPRLASHPHDDVPHVANRFVQVRARSWIACRSSDPELISLIPTQGHPFESTAVLPSLEPLEPCVLQLSAPVQEAASAPPLPVVSSAIGRDAVESSVRALAAGLLQHPRNDALRAGLAEGRIAAQELFREVLRAVYRILFVCAAEDRGALEEGSPQAVARFAACYSTGRLRRLAAAIRGGDEPDLWRMLGLVIARLAGAGAPELGLPSLGGGLLAHDTLALGFCDVPNRNLLECVRALVLRQQGQQSYAVELRAMPPEELFAAHGAMLELTAVVRDGALGLESAPGHARRATGSYYTPADLVDKTLGLTLEPLIDGCRTQADASRALLSVTVCDPACGTGNFLLPAARRMAAALAAFRAGAAHDAVGEVIRECIYGVDLNPTTLELCKAALWLEAGDSGAPLTFLDEHLRCGNALAGAPSDVTAAHRDSPRLAHEAADGWCATHGEPGCGPWIHWHLVFPQVWANGGFHAVIGNPPWIAHAGRAAQPLPPGLRSLYQACNPAFAGYRTTHGMFVYLGASILRPGGRLGLVIPTSVSDLDGYRPVRLAHDALCEPLGELPDFGDVFSGVFQPCMALVSVRRSAPGPDPTGAPWVLSRSDLSPCERELLATLTDLPPLPASLFGERGLQTTPQLRGAIDVRQHGPFTVPLREGADIQEFALLAPRLHADPDRLDRHLRRDWRSVDLLLRQTARFPIAAASDGLPFRNSLLAGFAAPQWPAGLLLCLLNSTLVRWLHYVRFRDARQGMPQVKIGHLRAIPAPPSPHAAAREALLSIGQRLSAANAGVPPQDRLAIDELVFTWYGVSAQQAELVRSWWASIGATR